MQERLSKGMKLGAAKGEALWLAKTFDARKRGHRWALRPGHTQNSPLIQGRDQAGRVVGWKVLAKVPQTDRLFDQEVIDRMGRDFYYMVFSPTVRYRFLAKRETYMDMRDGLIDVLNSPEGLPRLEGAVANI